MNPYKRITSFIQIFQVIIVTVSVWSASSAENALNTLINRDANIAVSSIIYLTLAGLVWILVSYFILPMLLKQHWFRKILMQEQYVEGAWFEEVRFSNGDVGLAVTIIAPRGNELSLSGITYSMDGSSQSSYQAVYYEFDWPILRYTHRNQPHMENDNAGALEGIAELHFEEYSRRHPKYYSGFFQHMGEMKRNRTEAYRISEKARVRLANPESRKELLTELLQAPKRARVDLGEYQNRRK